MPLIEDGDFRESLDGLFRTRKSLPALPSGSLFGANAAEAGQRHQEQHLLEPVLRGRTAVRDFAPEPLDLSTLTSVLTLAEHTYTTQRLRCPVQTTPLTALVGIVRVTGMPPGLYRCSTEGTYERLPHASAPPIHWSEAFTDAPAYVFIGGPVAITTPSSYAELLTHAGALGYAVWLAARTYGLDCCAYGTSNARLGQIMRQSDPVLRHMFTIVIGRAEGQRGGAGRPE